MSKKSVNFKQALDQVMAGPSAPATARAQAALRARLQKEQTLSVWYDYVPRTPLGPLWVALSDQGLVAVHYGADTDWLKQVRARGFRRAERSAEKTVAARRQLLDYLQRRRTSFDLRVDWRGMRDFQRRVLLAALAVPRGQTATYADIARTIGRPKAARAVGQALGHNPMPIVVPCHRVVASDGSLRGYTGHRGIATKARLLQLEGVS
jgi:methylated-DNA-[protein]-cysteine S-methyltransferase